MERIIRLTERDLTRIVKRVINEEQSQAKSKQMASQAKLKITSCWDAEKYPNTARALEGFVYANVTVGLLAAAAALASTGVGIPAALLMVAGMTTFSAALVDALATILSVNWQFKREINELSSCLFKNLDYFDIF